MAETDGQGEGDSLTRAIEEPVALVDHDVRWDAMFDTERVRLMVRLPGTFVEIAHIGSTAVEGLRAKPIIDLLAGVRSMDVAFAIGPALLANGYAEAKGINANLRDRQFYLRHANGRRTHHLHLVVHGSQAWHDRIGFRDRLRADPTLHDRYADLKQKLATKFADDRDAYTDAKSTFILRAVNDGEP